MNKNTKFSNFSFLLFAETHGYLDDFKMIKRLIMQQKPDYVLYELAEDNIFLESKDFENVLRQHQISEMTEIKDIKPVLKICQKYHLPVIGIDFKNFGIKNPENVKEKNENKEEPTEKKMKEFMELLIKREQHQIKLIKEYQKKGKILVITGAFHLREDSPFWKELKNVIVVYPTYKNEIVLEPNVKKQRISYKIKKQ
ncbi:MAG: hypothetical protein V1914_02225 [archaeon]